MGQMGIMSNAVLWKGTWKCSWKQRIHSVFLSLESLQHTYCLHEAKDMHSWKLIYCVWVMHTIRALLLANSLHLQPPF